MSPGANSSDESLAVSFSWKAVELESGTIALYSESHYFFIADLCDFRNYIKCFSLGNYVSSSKTSLGS